MTTTSTVHIARIEDHEGHGRCGHCGRENLRWIAVMSDGTQVGTECAKRVLGIKISPAKHKWVSHFEAVTERVEYGQTWVLWQQKNGRETRETVNGMLRSIGGCRSDWERKGWLN